jgi:hypothetical protein
MKTEIIFAKKRYKIYFVTFVTLSYLEKIWKMNLKNYYLLKNVENGKQRFLHFGKKIKDFILCYFTLKKSLPYYSIWILLSSLIFSAIHNDYCR